jgi:hypothetical protein
MSVRFLSVEYAYQMIARRVIVAEMAPRVMRTIARVESSWVSGTMVAVSPARADGPSGIVDSPGAAMDA